MVNIVRRMNIVENQRSTKFKVNPFSLFCQILLLFVSFFFILYEEWKLVNIVESAKYKGNPFTGNQLSVQIKRIRKGFSALPQYIQYIIYILNSILHICSWSPNSTYLHLDFYLLSQHTQKRRHSRVICYHICTYSQCTDDDDDDQG